jgi:crossover junction endodeoxyribonuclease RusA
VVKITLPWPPSVNHYWRRNGSTYFVSAEGRAYKGEVNYICRTLNVAFKAADRLKILIQAYPPDKRRRDLDNILKSLLDSLQYAGVYEDDNQIDQIIIQRNIPLTGEIVVTIGIADHQGMSSS